MSHLLIAKISLGLVLVMSIVGIIFALLVFTAVEVTTPPVYTTSPTAPPVLTAGAWQVFDLESGEILYENNAEVVLPIASITKLFTGFAVLELSSLDMPVTITWSDLNTEGEAGRLQFGDEYTNRVLLFPLLLESSNDAAAALVRVNPEILEAIKILNEELGLQNTILRDTSGLSDGNVSSAYELSRVTRYFYQARPHLFDITRIPEYYTAENGWINNSPFIDEEAYRGGKHGFTYAANRTTVALFAEQISGSERLLGYVLLGSDDLAADMADLRVFVQENTSYR